MESAHFYEDSRAGLAFTNHWIPGGELVVWTDRGDDRCLAGLGRRRPPVARGRRVGILLPASLAYVIIRGLTGVLTGSDDVYFGLGVALSAATAVAIGATAFTYTPAASYLIPLVVTYRQEVVDHPRYLRIAAQLTVAWALMELAITGWEASHLTRVTATEFIVLRTFVGWPVMAIWLFLLVFYFRFRLDPPQHALAGDVPARWGKGSNRR